MGLFISGYVARVCTARSSSLVMSVNLRTIVTRRKYLEIFLTYSRTDSHLVCKAYLNLTLAPVYVSYGFSTWLNSKSKLVFCVSSPGLASSLTCIQRERGVRGIKEVFHDSFTSDKNSW